MVKNKNGKKVIIDIIFIALGCILLAFAITSILKPNGLITGGITGISIIMEKLTGLKYTYVYYTLSITILIGAFIMMGKSEAKKIILVSIIFPFVLILFETMDLCFIENDTLLASIYYGIIGGTGCGLILKRGFSLGGTDTVAKIINKRFLPFISISQVLLIIDVVVILSSVLIYDRNIALYAVLTQIILVKTIDMVLFGFQSRHVKIEIISNKNDEIVDYILNAINRGVSLNEIKGAYTNHTRQKIVSLCSPREVMLIKMFVAKTDPQAFVSVVPVISVWGNGVGFENLVEAQN